MQPQRQDRYSDGAVSELEHKPDLDDGSSLKPRQTTNGSGQPRRRISRACDQCNQLRTKCDGKNPCQHCVELGLTCEYARARKKRGKASRKDIAAQQATDPVEAQETAAGSEDDRSSEDVNPVPKADTQRGEKRKRASPTPTPGSLSLARPTDRAHQQQPDLNAYSMSHVPAGYEYTGGSVTSNPLGEHIMRHHSSVQPLDLTVGRTPGAVLQGPGISGTMGDMASVDDYHHRNASLPNPALTGHNVLHPGSSAYALPSPNRQMNQAYHMGGSPISTGIFGSSPVGGSPNWLGLHSPNSALQPPVAPGAPNPALRYPVLRPLLPHISSIIPIGLACDLLDLYFSSTSTTFMQPQSPYILGYVFRKRSFFRDKPRPCSPALLASMLWIAAQTSESPHLTSPPSARGKICQKLLELTVGLLKPLIHTSNEPAQLYGGGLVINGVALGGFGMSLPGQAHEMDVGNPGASGVLDDVATYIHLATVVSASEYKAASLRWWNAAWTLARELKLGREVPSNPGGLHPAGQETEAEVRSEDGIGDRPEMCSEEEREERRRIWWLLFSVDRHLALCYNRPLFLLDIECDGLLQPDDDINWQTGEYYARNTVHTPNIRTRGPSSECTGHGMFGYFLPLMTILGEIVDLNHARNHPRFGQRFKSTSQWDDQSHETTQRLLAYGRSLTAFESSSQPKTTGSKDSGSDTLTTTSVPRRMTETVLQTKIQVAYSTHLMHTFHVLLHGKWDPISLLDDNDLWISSESFVSATAHAVSAAEALDEILEYDPDLSFMPFFFGIYLLQGSFLLLLIADKLQADANPSVVKACETIVRAHEACVVTLNTEYQRNFRKVMRSALAQVRGRGVEDLAEAFRRRETLALYRWTPGGGGLAL